MCWSTKGSPNLLFYRCKLSRRLQTILLFHKTQTKIGDSEGHWRLPSSPIVRKIIRISHVNSKVCWFTQGSPKPLFYRCKFSWRLQTILLFHKTREIIAAYEPYWRLPSSPVVRPKHKDLLCKFKSVLIYTRIAKPFILPLQIFVTITNNTTCSQNSTNNEGIWALLAAPVVANSETKA